VTVRRGIVIKLRHFYPMTMTVGVSVTLNCLGHAQAHAQGHGTQVVNLMTLARRGRCL
jgi:hypothetical protein